jgi:methylphosphotriester-DNA--protein-cysteine methyltransferase
MSIIYRVVGADGNERDSMVPGTLGGHRGSRIYGRLDCPSALRWIERGHYVRHRVFFLTASDAVDAGYRPCAVCMRTEYLEWKSATARREK